MNSQRENILRDRRRIVVKLGSMVLAGPGGGVDQRLIGSLADEITDLAAKKYRFIIVSSGAILMGMHQLGRRESPRVLKVKQALAAVGQGLLMNAYETAFSRHRITVGQMLLTRDDLENRRRFVNARNTLETSLRLGIIPIINENDTVAVDEIQYGDNDFLSSMVVNLTDADLLVILTDIAGLYDRDPKLGDGHLIEVVDQVNDTVFRMAGGPGEAGSGGMSSKVLAAKRTARMGIPTVIADGRSSGILTRILEGAPEGTLFLPASEKLASRKHWIAFVGGIGGTLVLDDGAVKALVEDKKSLLPAGILEVHGSFEQGSLVRCVDRNGEEIARGVTCFSSGQIRKIMGRHSQEIEPILGACPGTEVIHRDDLALGGRS
ncbi:MAG: glutamate 5-kinase [Deltaproteobacteria bacterium]|nr:glutamate 5-kinase [Deltaproteobacteria bacterium]